jgi:hypothetical protein
MGSATATVQFFRSMGATFGVAAFGTIFLTRLTSDLVSRVGPAAAEHLIALVNTPGNVHIPPALANDLRQSLSSSLHHVFVGVLFVSIVALLFAFVLKEKPLRTTSNVSAALSSEMGPVSEEGAQETAEATHERAPTGQRAQ